MAYSDGIKIKGGWTPKGRKNDKNLTSYDDKRDAYWTEVADQYLDQSPKKSDENKLNKILKVK
jgi:hypothetical protein|tara:strand:- start:37 stop:225 length:189 start_codon:yes stop_codon:yes gene_type:complete